jgi:hypothetical protein
MDKRRHQRSSAEFDVKVTALSHRGCFGSGTVRNFSRSGVSIDLPFELAIGDSVRLDLADSSLFGHIVYTHPEGPLFRTGIEIMQVLLGGTDMAHLLQSVLNETMPGIPGAQRVIA